MLAGPWMLEILGEDPHLVNPFYLWGQAWQKHYQQDMSAGYTAAAARHCFDTATRTTH